MRVWVIRYNSHTIFDRLEFFTPRCQICQLFIGHIFTRPMLQQKFKISINIQIVCFCHLNHCINHCTDIRSVYWTASSSGLLHQVRRYPLTWELLKQTECPGAQKFELVTFDIYLSNQWYYYLNDHHLRLFKVVPHLIVLHVVLLEYKLYEHTLYS